MGLCHNRGGANNNKKKKRWKHDWLPLVPKGVHEHVLVHYFDWRSLLAVGRISRGFRQLASREDVWRDRAMHFEGLYGAMLNWSPKGQLTCKQTFALYWIMEPIRDLLGNYRFFDRTRFLVRLCRMVNYVVCLDGPKVQPNLKEDGIPEENLIALVHALHRANRLLAVCDFVSGALGVVAAD